MADAQTLEKLPAEEQRDPYVEEAEMLVKAYVIGAVEDATGSPGSQQLLEDDFAGDRDVIQPPHNLLLWAMMGEINTRLCRSITTMARNTVGLGWEIVPKVPITLDTSEEVRKAIEIERLKLIEFFEMVNTDLPFTDLMYNEKVDEEATGNGYLEFIRNLRNDIAQICNIPSHTVRVRKPTKSKVDLAQTLTGFVQIRNGKKKFFKHFGDPRIIDSTTGELTGPNTPITQRATELYHWKVYTPRSSWYGMPRFTSAAAAIAGNDLAAKRNVTFFENDACPRVAVLVEGGTLTAESVKSIEKFVARKGKGTDNAHRAMVLQAEPTRVGINPTDKTKISIEKLTVGVTEDASFLKYREYNDDEVREAFGISEAFFKTSDTNRASALAGRSITNEQVFEPERNSKEYVVNRKILGDQTFEAKYNKFKFTRPQPTDPLQMATIDASYSREGALTLNDLRARIGMPPYPESFEFGHLPLRIALEKLRLQMVEARSANSSSTPTKKEPAKSDGGGRNDETP